VNQLGDSTSSGRYKRPESVVVVVYTTTGETLLLKRLQPVFWQSVTGSLERPSETPEHAAHREVYEETGIESATGWFDWKISRYFPILSSYRDRFAPGIRVNQEHMFSLQLPEPRSVNLMREEHSESEWLPLTKSRDIVWSWTNRAALDQVVTLRARDRTDATS
jgi:dATP pyrophosphohydrolase